MGADLTHSATAPASAPNENSPCNVRAREQTSDLEPTVVHRHSRWCKRMTQTPIDQQAMLEVGEMTAAVMDQPTQSAMPETAVECLRALSPSKAKTFKSCPLRFKFNYIDRIPEPVSPASARGTLVHAVLEDLFQMPAHERTVSAAQEAIDAAWQRMQEAQPDIADFSAHTAASGDGLVEQIKADASQLLEVYFELEDPTQVNPAATESKVSVELANGVPIRGIIDRVDVAPGGQVRIVDYKSGKSPRAGMEQTALFQMRFYALMWWRIYGTVPSRLQLVYLGDRQVVIYTPSEEDLLALERTLGALWSAITSAVITDSWAPNRSTLCRWCAYQNRCPIFASAS